MIDDDEIVIAAKQLTGDQPSSTESLRDSVVKALTASALPFGIGSALVGIVTDVADSRWKERVAQLIKMLAERIAALGEPVESDNYYASEEFQALFIEAIDQQRANRYVLKRKMLAQGLAHSGIGRFVGESEKESFFRILRDLSPADIQMLQRLSQPTDALHMGLFLRDKTSEHVMKAKSADTRIYRLQGSGLVTTFQRLPAPKLSGINKIEDQGALNRFIADALGAEPQVVVVVSPFGRRFISFLLQDASATEPEAPQVDFGPSA